MVQSVDNNLYEILNELCRENGIRMGTMFTTLGCSRSVATELKKNRTLTLSMDTIRKIADFFDIPTDVLFGRDKYIEKENGDETCVEVEETAKGYTGLESVLEDARELVELLERAVELGRELASTRF